MVVGGWVGEGGCRGAAQKIDRRWKCARSGQGLAVRSRRHETNLMVDVGILAAQRRLSLFPATLWLLGVFEIEQQKMMGNECVGPAAAGRGGKSDGRNNKIRQSANEATHCRLFVCVR